MYKRQVLAALADLRDEGLVIGLSLSGPAQDKTLLKAIDIRSGGAPLFGAVQATWNLLAREAGDALRQAHAAGMGVIIKEALANGRLTDRNNDPAFATQRRLLEDAAAEAGASLDAVALAAALAQPWAGIVLSGAARADHLHSNVAAIDLSRQRAWLDTWLPRFDSLAEAPEAYWQARSGLAWN